MKYFISALFLFALSLELAAQHSLIRQGHRGCRGLMPENTIESMKKALDIGVDVLEIDIVISKDKQVVVSHDAYMASEFCLKPNGDTISVAEQKNIILYNMFYHEIKRYDVGTKPHPQFPDQQHFKAYKPLMAELVDSTDAYAERKGLPAPRYNIEIKSNPNTDGLHQPPPEEFVAIVLALCRDKQLMNRMNIQSFDVRPLQVIHRQDSSIEIAYLTSNMKTVQQNLEDLGFVPDIYSPHYKAVSKNVVDTCHNKGMKIIPWTVNTPEEMKGLAALGVDGIITDFPNYFEELE